MIHRIKKIISANLVTPTIVNPLSHDLTGSVIVITGASRGIGKATADILKNENAQIIAVARSKEMLTKAFPGSPNKNVTPYAADITNEKDILNFHEWIIRKFKKVDILINNVGQFLDKPLEEITTEEFDSIVQTNIKGMFLMTKVFLPAMKKRKAGCIINIGSKISRNTNVTPKKVLYAMTKYAVEGFSFALGKELKPFGIRVICLMPGTINNFVSLKSKQFLSPSQVGMLISAIIKMKDIDFENIVFKSIHQNI